MEDNLPEQNNESADDTEKPHPKRNLLSLLLPPDQQVVRQARVLAGDRNFRITKLAGLVGEDPVIVLELLRAANAAFYSSDRPAIAHVQTAVVRLGSAFLLKLFDSLEARPPITEPDIMQCFETIRTMSARISLVSRIIAQNAQPQIADIAETTGLFTNCGQMLACLHFGQTFVEEAKNRKRSALAYRFIQEYHLDINSLQLDYLRKNGVPTIIFYGLDRELKCKTTTQSALRFIVESAIEMVEAHREQRWDKYDPERELPAHSALRMLSLASYQYQQIFDIVDAYLAERSQGEAGENENTAKAMSQDFPEIEEGYEEPSEPTLILRKKGFVPLARPKRKLPEPVKEPWEDNPRDFREDLPTSISEILKVQEHSLRQDSLKVLKLMEGICLQSQTSQDLLARILLLLVSEGMFSRAALISLSPSRDEAEIHLAVGEGFAQDGVIQVTDPLSPLALSLTKIQSFNSRGIEDSLSPFGVSAYAVSPIQARHKTPVVLYADCGLLLPLPLESRKIFRVVIDLLNQTLPRLKGGLPKKSIQKLQAEAAPE